jgi:prephenate dehydrogenase
LDPETHDRWVASTSHMPYLAANALASVTPEEAGPLVGPGLRSTTRLAATPWTMMRDILETNRPSLLDCLRIYRAKIEALERLLMDEDFQGLERSLAEGARIYDSYKK